MEEEKELEKQKGKGKRGTIENVNEPGKADADSRQLQRRCADRSFPQGR